MEAEHDDVQKRVEPYLDRLFLKLHNKYLENVETATTPLIGLATGGMRGRLEGAEPGGPVTQQSHPRRHSYNLLLAKIKAYFLAANVDAHTFRPTKS